MKGSLREREGFAGANVKGSLARAGRACWRKRERFAGANVKGSLRERERLAGASVRGGGGGELARTGRFFLFTWGNGGRIGEGGNGADDGAGDDGEAVVVQRVGGVGRLVVVVVAEHGGIGNHDGGDTEGVVVAVVGEVEFCVVGERSVDAGGGHVFFEFVVEEGGEVAGGGIAHDGDKVAGGGEHEAVAGEDGGLAVGLIGVVAEHFQTNEAEHFFGVARGGVVCGAHVGCAEPRGFFAGPGNELYGVVGLLFGEAGGELQQGGYGTGVVVCPGVDAVVGAEVAGIVMGTDDVAGVVFARAGGADVVVGFAVGGGEFLQVDIPAVLAEVVGDVVPSFGEGGTVAGVLAELLYMGAYGGLLFCRYGDGGGGLVLYPCAAGEAENAEQCGNVFHGNDGLVLRTLSFILALLV